MSNWAVFLTAARPSMKALNRALLLIQDFEYSEYPAESSWMLLTSKDLPAASGEFKATALPLSELAGNDFAGMSLAEINAFVRAHADALERMDLSASDWLVIDEKGMETSTCLVCEQYYSSGEDEDGNEIEGEEEGMTDRFRACRLPYEEAQPMIANLSIANMGFEEFVDEDEGEQEDGSWKWVSFDPDTQDNKEPTDAEIKRKEELKKLRDGGHAD